MDQSQKSQVRPAGRNADSHRKQPRVARPQRHLKRPSRFLSDIEMNELTGSDEEYEQLHEFYDEDGDNEAEINQAQVERELKEVK